jgi:predicted nucleic acid-binding protein
VTRPSFVVDNSVVMAWGFEDETSKYADAVLGSLAMANAIVPAIWPLEVGNVLLTAERRKRLSHADSVRFLALIANLPIAVEPESPQRMLNEIFALARDLRLSTYDASYLDLAMRTGLPLATQDSALLKAAKKSQTPIFDPPAPRRKPLRGS